MSLINLRPEFYEMLSSPKRVTPEEEYIRMEENLWVNRGSVITNYETFDKAYDDYFETALKPRLDNKEIKTKLWEILKEKRKIGHRELFVKARGKDFGKDKAHLAKKVVVSAKDYIRLGAQNVDLAGYDTPKDYVYPGKQRTWKTNKSKIVYARPLWQRNKQLTYRDRLGKFVSIKKK